MTNFVDATAKKGGPAGIQHVGSNQNRFGHQYDGNQVGSIIHGIESLHLDMQQMPAGQYRGPYVHGPYMDANSMQLPNPMMGMPHQNPVYISPSHLQAVSSQGMYHYNGPNIVDSVQVGMRVPSNVSNMPSLLQPQRSGSLSSNDEAVPGTPGYNTYFGGPTIFERSPSAAFGTQNNTPSPTTYTHAYQGMAPGILGSTRSAKQYLMPVVLSDELQALLEQEPRIPRAIPAPNSPVKSLDRCLENKNGETNVYIRGLMPETTDDMLENYGKRFGDISSSKAIIDHKNNLCKGFGFVKFFNFEDAEKCIRIFHFLGYEVSFARESFYSKLKKFSDESNTNLYVSNIPRSMNEHELANIFDPFKVLSARILRDENGNGRGVGFARFENRDVCEEVIKTFNNTEITKRDVAYQIQIRYSDTAEQKMLKQQTAAARQFRAAEFEAGCAQVGRVFGSQPESTRPTHGSRYGEGPVNEFESYLQQNTASMHSFRHGNGGPRIPLPTIHSDQSFPHSAMNAPTVHVQDVDEDAAKQAVAGAEQN